MPSKAALNQPALQNKWRIVGEHQGITVTVACGIAAVILLSPVSTFCIVKETDKPVVWILNRLDQLLFTSL